MSAPDLTLALLALNMGYAPRSMAEVRDTVADALVRAGDQGASLLALPEYWCEAWLPMAPRGLAETEEIPWMAERADDLLPGLADLAREAGVALLAGTVPVAAGGGRYRNRAHLFLPDKRVLIQDKLSLTPDERDPESWNLEPGTRLDVVTWRGLRIAVVICLDVEQPSLAARLQGLDLDLVLVPTDTGRPSGHGRVFGCARARAVELMAAVAPVGGVGPIPLDPPRPNHSAAAVYVPCEMGIAGGTGVVAEAAGSDASEGLGTMLVARDVPFGAVRAMRREGEAEVWCGAWDAGRITIGEVA
ncbi:MAG: nitrilase [Geminicoccaceae bacterium]|nr:nitrilase [Geminicoccaceae bacterium]